MDAAGARHLRRAIDQHEHWRRAPAVRDGEQPARDPDALDLVDFEGEVRRYRSRDGALFEKRLREGHWI